MDKTNEFPGTVGQVENYLKSRSRVHKDMLGTEHQVHGIHVFAIHGLTTLMPEEIKASGYLEDGPKLKLVDNLLRFHLALNDRVDFAYLPPELSELKDKATQAESIAKNNLEQSMEAMNSPDLRVFIEASIAELEYVEEYVRIHQDKLSFHEIEMYRNLVNIINNCLIVAIIFGREQLANKLPILTSEKMTWDEIVKKYTWVFAATGETKLEKAITLMHHLAMAMQVDDDWHGRRIDKVIGIESLATAALNETGDERSARELLNGVKAVHIQKAKQLGLSSLGISVIDFVQNNWQSFIGWSTRKARYADGPLMKKVLSVIIKHTMGPREQLFADNKL